MCVQVLVHAFVFVCLCMCMGWYPGRSVYLSRQGKKNMLFLGYAPLGILRKLPTLPKALLASEPQESKYIYLPSSGIINMCHMPPHSAFWVGLRGFGPQNFAANALLTI